MKKPLFAVVILVASGGAMAQLPTTITTVSSAGGLGPVTTISPSGNGYTYTTIGGPRGGEWGIVEVTGGNNVSAAVSPLGGVVPIVTPAAPPTTPTPALMPNPLVVSAQIAAANARRQEEEMRQFEADMAHLEPIPDIPAMPRSRRVERAIPVYRPDPLKNEFTILFNKLGSEERRAEFWRDFQADFPAGSATNFQTPAALPYLKLWLRDHQTPLPPSTHR